MALAANALAPITAQSAPKISGGINYNRFGLHPECGDMADIFNSGDLSFVCNMGNLAQPTTKRQLQNNEVSVVPKLFAHDGQRRMHQSEPTDTPEFGWGAGVAKALESRNPDNGLSPMISVAGRNVFHAIQDPSLSMFSLASNGLVKLNRFGGARAAAMNDIMNDDQGHLMANELRNTFLRARLSEDKVSRSLDIAGNSGVDYDGIFQRAGAARTKLGEQLNTVAKIIGGAEASGNRRPVFFVRMPGFDNHRDLLSSHQDLMKELNDALKAFRICLQAAGNFDKVLTCTGSEFGRTFTSNGSGTDHGWSGNSILMGGMIRGGRLFGTYPNLELGGVDDLPGKISRGRWIPTTSASQISAVICNWFGVPANGLAELFPSLRNFNDPFSQAQNISFIQGGNLS